MISKEIINRTVFSKANQIVRNDRHMVDETCEIAVKIISLENLRTCYTISARVEYVDMLLRVIFVSEKKNQSSLFFPYSQHFLVLLPKIN